MMKDNYGSFTLNNLMEKRSEIPASKAADVIWQDLTPFL